MKPLEKYMNPFYLRVSKLQSCFYFKLNSSVEVRIWMQNNTLLLHLHLWLANIVVVKIKTNVRSPLLHSEPNFIIQFGNCCGK